MLPHPLILASTSRYRRALLEKLAMPFTCAAPDIEESAHAGESASALAARLALAKARATGLQQPDQAWIIGSDQTCACGDLILGKPGTVQAAEEQLGLLSGRRVDFHTGLCLWQDDNHYQLAVETFTVEFRNLQPDQIRRYIEIEQPLDCAGSFKNEGLGICLFTGLHGRDPNALTGLPLILLTDMLANWGVTLPLGASAQ